jgi:hypothetical protein
MSQYVISREFLRQCQYTILDTSGELYIESNNFVTDSTSLSENY